MNSGAGPDGGVHARGALLAVLAGTLLVAGPAWGQRGANRDGKAPEPQTAPVTDAPASPDASQATAEAERFRSQVARSALRERAIELMVEATLSNDPLSRANAIEGLQPAPKRAEAVVRAGLADENPGVRFVAAMTVAQLKLKSSVAFVEPLLSDTDPRVKAAAIHAMWACGKRPDPSPIGEMLMDPDARIRGEAARITGLMGNPTAIPMLKSAAAEADRRNRQMGGASEQQFQLERLFQLQVAEALARLGEPSATDSLRAALYPTGREGLESAALAAQMLGDLKEQKAAAQLIDLVEAATPETARNTDVRQRQFVQPKEVRLAAATALAKMNYRDGVYVAQSLAADPDPAVRAQTAFLLATGGTTADLAVLERMMDDPVEMVRVAASASALRLLDRLR